MTYELFVSLIMLFVFLSTIFFLSRFQSLSKLHPYREVKSSIEKYEVIEIVILVLTHEKEEKEKEKNITHNTHIYTPYTHTHTHQHTHTHTRTHTQTHKNP